MYVKFDIGDFMKSFEKFQILLKWGTSHVNLCTLHYCQRYLNLHKSAVFKWNGMLLGWLRRYKWSDRTVPAVMQFLNIPKHKRQRDSKYCILRKKKLFTNGYSFWKLLYCIYSGVRWSNSKDNSPFTIPIQNLLLLCVWFSGNSPKSSCLIFW